MVFSTLASTSIRQNEMLITAVIASIATLHHALEIFCGFDYQNSIKNRLDPYQTRLLPAETRLCLYRLRLTIVASVCTGEPKHQHTNSVSIKIVKPLLYTTLHFITTPFLIANVRGQLPQLSNPRSGFILSLHIPSL